MLYCMDAASGWHAKKQAAYAQGTALVQHSAPFYSQDTQKAIHAHQYIPGVVFHLKVLQ